MEHGWLILICSPHFEVPIAEQAKLIISVEKIKKLTQAAETIAK
jgi:hypothetical protein